MFGLNAPSITQAQIAAAVAWIVAQLVAMGAIDETLSQTLVSAGVTAVSLAWIIGDAIIRQGRAKAAGAAAAAGVQPSTISAGTTNPLK